MMGFQLTTCGEGYGYTEEEWLLKQNLRKFIQEEVDPRFKENYTDETADPFYHEMMKKLGAQGFLRVAVPEPLGGYGMRLTALMIVTEEVTRGNGALGIHAMENPVVGLGMALSAPAAWAKYGEGILSGNLVLAAAQNSPEGQCNFVEQADIGKLEGDEWVLNGEKAFSSGGTFCDVLIVLGLVEGTAYLWVLDPRNTPGLTITKNPEIGNSPTYATLSLRNVRVPKEMGGPLGSIVDRKPVVEAPASKIFPLACGALAMGSMGAAFDKTVEYLKHRTSGFKPIASLGSIQDKLARMKMQMEAARSFLLIATQMIEQNHKDALLYVPLAKAFICDTARYITAECVQLHGCVGINPDSGIVRYMLDATGFGIGVCGSEMHLATAAKYMGLPGAEWECL